MTVLVTGATGFLGGVHLRKLMNEEGYSGKDIRILAMEHENIDEYKSMGVEPFIGNLQFPETLQRIMKDITTVYHIAAIVVNEAVNREVMMKVNFEGTKELANQFLKEESTEKFVF
ncbi:MAG: NAD-dependent epimerase/dehydratase family protein, partial [Candidatus Thorarchaeota archaeon]